MNPTGADKRHDRGLIGFLSGGLLLATTGIVFAVVTLLNGKGPAPATVVTPTPPAMAAPSPTHQGGLVTATPAPTFAQSVPTTVRVLTAVVEPTLVPTRSFEITDMLDATATPTLLLDATIMPTASATRPRPAPRPPSKGGVTLDTPAAGAKLQGVVMFQWKPSGGFALAAGEGYELIFWNPGQDPMRDGRSPTGASSKTSVSVNMGIAEKSVGFGPGQHLWGVRLWGRRGAVRLLSVGRPFQYE